jgi:hypothetical protein
MRIFEDGRIFIGKIDLESKDQNEIDEIESNSFEIEDDSEEAKQIMAGGKVTVNDVATKDFEIEAPIPSMEKTAFENLQDRFDNDLLDESDLPDMFTVIKDLYNR